MIRTSRRNGRPLLRRSRVAVLIGTLLVMVGCRNETAETADIPEAAAVPTPGEQGVLSSALDALKDGASRVQRAVEPYASPIQSTAVESVQKMLAIEYQIVEVGLDESTDILEMQLKRLGAERWDCTSMPPSFNRARFLCKRYPMTSYLKAISLLGKLTPD